MSMRWWTECSPVPHKRINRYITGIVCLSLVFASGCSLLPKEAAQEVLPTINPPKLSQKPEYTVKTNTLETKVRGAGQIMATKEEELFFIQDNKRVKDVYVQPGQKIEKGQLIAELDVTDLESQLRTKRLQVRKDELNMITTLRNADGKASDELEQAKVDFAMKQEDIKTLEETISNAKLTAPFSGSLVGVYVKKGDTAKAYDTIAVLADLSELTIAVTITADDLKKVAVGMEAAVDINAAGQQKGKVKQLPNPKSDVQQNGGGYDPRFGGYIGGNAQKPKDSISNYLLIELDQAPGNLSRGTPLSASITVQKKENVVVIPTAALRSITGRNYVQVVDDKGAKREVDIEIGQQTSTEVEIVKGLTPGQKVVGR